VPTRFALKVSAIAFYLWLASLVPTEAMAERIVFAYPSPSTTLDAMPAAPDEEGTWLALSQARQKRFAQALASSYRGSRMRK